MIASETSSALSTRGIYANNREKGYVSAYDVNRPDCGAQAEYWWKFYDERPYLEGGFVWTGLTTAGSPRPTPSPASARTSAS